VNALALTGRLTLTVLAVALAALFGVASGLGALLGAATGTARPPLFLLAGLAAFCAVYLLGLLLVTRKVEADRRRHARAVLFCTGTALVVGLFAWTALLPMGTRGFRPRPSRDNASGSSRPVPVSPMCAFPPKVADGRPR